MPDNRITLRTALELIVVLGGILGIVFLFDAYVDKKIESAIANPAYLRNVAAQVRPSLIFTSNEVVLADMGGTQRVISLQVQRDSVDVPQRIVVTVNDWQAVPPILSAADETQWFIETTRGPQNRWEYDLTPISYQSAKRTGPPLRSEEGSFRFRLEFVVGQ